MFAMAVLVVVLASSPSYVSAERGVSFHNNHDLNDVGNSNLDLAEELPLACDEVDAKQVPKDKKKDDKKDKDKKKKDKEKDKKKKDKKKKEEPKKKDKDSLQQRRRTGRPIMSARHRNLSSINATTTDVGARPLDAFEKVAPTEVPVATIGVASA